MTLQLTYTGDTHVPVEVEGIIPDQVADKGLAQIERLQIFHGNEAIPLAEMFQVAGDPSDGQIDWSGDLTGVHWIGAGMKSGNLRILGDAGRHIGSEMSGGRIEVQGNSSDWVGAEMCGGVIHVRGSAGHLVGAAYRGSPRGMAGGTIMVDGNVGNEVGHSMRRGLLAVGGSSGDLVGFNMLAGTVLVLGEGGIRHGAGMRRGTIGFLGDDLPELLPSFRYACRLQPPALPLLLQQLVQQEFPAPRELFETNCQLYQGDMIEGGRGEIWLRAS